MNLKDFEYVIPKIPSVKDLIKNILKRLKRTDKKINFLAHHFIQDLRHIPLRLFTDDNEDTE